jgi:membrane dipeptidase
MRVIQEMNTWGIMVDVSHPSKGAMMQAIGLSKAPVIASHSAVRTLANHSRNLDDEMLMAIKTNGGVAQIVAFASYVKTDPAERGPAIAALRQEFALPGGRGGGAGAGRANVKDFVDHIDYAVKLIGIDHVGISSDFDGGGGIDGWNSAAETFNVTLELVRRGYTEEQIGKIWSGRQGYSGRAALIGQA